MPIPVKPFASVIKYTPHSSGNVIDFGHCFTDKVLSQWGSDEYTFSGLIPEYNTDSLMTQPILAYVLDNSAIWTPVGADWQTVAVPGYPSGRTIYKWAKAVSEDTYELTSGPSYAAGEPIVFEIGMLATPDTAVEPSIELKWGSDTAKITITKTGSPVLSIKSGGVWTAVSSVPLTFKMLWRDLATEFIWIIPIYNGLLISTDGVDFIWIRPASGINIGSGTLSIAGSGGVACFAAHRVTFADASITSAIVETGSEPANLPVGKWFGHVGDGLHTLTKNAVDSASYRYQLSLAPGVTPMAVRRVSIDHPPELLVTNASSVTINEIEEVDEAIPEDPSEETCTVTIDNPAGIHSGQFKRFDTVSWNFGWVYDNASVVSVQRNTGIVTDVSQVVGEGGEGQIKLKLKPLLQKLKDGTVIYAPDYGGWLFEDMLSDFLLRQGIPLNMQVITPRGVTIPVSTEREAWQPKIGDRAWDWIERIVYHTLGWWIHTNRTGQVVIEPYPEVENQTWTGVFTIQPHQIEQLEYLQPEEAISEIRNIFYVYGLTDEGYPVASIIRDEGSLWNPLAPNYIGYAKPMLRREAGYTTQEFCDFVCYSLYQRYHKLRNAIKFTTHPRAGATNLYPGALTGIVHTDNSTDWIIVRSVSSRIIAGEFQQTVYGHYITE
jgi:hypothetical protein